MKFEYKSPVVTVEELYKVDVLCDSPSDPNPPVTPQYHDNRKFDISELM